MAFFAVITTLLCQLSRLLGDLGSSVLPPLFLLHIAKIFPFFFIFYQSGELHKKCGKRWKTKLGNVRLM